MELKSQYPHKIGNKIEKVERFLDKNLKSKDHSLSEPLSHLVDAGGKRVRPLMFLLMFEGIETDADVDDVIPVASAFEAIHTATLIQDDLPSMDNDGTRRGVESVHNRYDSTTAILASNILQSMSFSWVSSGNIYNKIDNPQEKRDDVSSEIDQLVLDLCLGQRKDLDFEDKSIHNHTRENYLEVARRKTASLYRRPLKIAGLLSDETKESVRNLENLGLNFGISYQIADDILDYTLTDRDRYSDMKNQRITIVSVKASNSEVPLFDTSIPQKERVDMLKQNGCISESVSELEYYTSQALDCLRGTDLNKNQEILETIIKYNKIRVNQVTKL